MKIRMKKRIFAGFMAFLMAVGLFPSSPWNKPVEAKAAEMTLSSTAYELANGLMGMAIDTDTATVKVETNKMVIDEKSTTGGIGSSGKTNVAYIYLPVTLSGLYKITADITVNSLVDRTDAQTMAGVFIGVTNDDTATAPFVSIAARGDGTNNMYRQKADGTYGGSSGTTGWIVPTKETLGLERRLSAEKNKFYSTLDGVDMKNTNDVAASLLAEDFSGQVFIAVSGANVTIENLKIVNGDGAVVYDQSVIDLGSTEPASRKDWSEVEVPAIGTPVQESGSVKVPFTMVIGNDGADYVTVTMTGDGAPVTKTYDSESTEGSVSFTPSKSGAVSFTIMASREGEEDKAGNTVPFDYVLPLGKSTISSLTSQNGGVDITYTAVAEATGYVVEYSTDGITWTTTEEVTTLNLTITGLMIGCEYYFRVVAKRGMDSSVSESVICREIKSFYNYIVKEDNTIEISGWKGTDPDITIPSTINGIRVTSIGNSAFWNCVGLESVIIPGSVTYIDNFAFWDCSSLESITISEGVMNIGAYAFENCSSLKNVTIPESVTSIGSDAFSGCSSLESITIPEGITSIASSVFENCSNLKNVTIPESVTSIEAYAFRGCSSLESITIPKGVTSIERSTFYNCSSLTSITIPEDITSIGSYAFDSCSSLTSITMPEGIISIDTGAFRFCSGITSITIPESVTSIGSYVFMGCSSLTDIIVPANNQNYASADGVLFNKNLTELISCPGGKTENYIIPESVTTIAAYAFSRCDSLTSITIPESVTSIADPAFSYCVSLTGIKVSDNNQNYASVDDVLFNKNLTELICCPGGKTGTYIIPESVTSITSSAFAGCGSLTGITIPEGITSIGDYTFDGCSSLTSVTIPKGVTTIGVGAFRLCSSLTSIIIPEGVTSILRYAFKDCSSLTSIIIPESVTSIGMVVFSGCSSLTIKCYSGSYAETYANDNDIPVEYITEPEIEKKNGLIYDSTDGKWYYYVDDEIDTSFIGLAQGADSVFWYVNEGAVDTSYTGFVTNASGTWYVAAGKVDTGFTGLGKEGDSWIPVFKGKAYPEFTGIIQNAGYFWYINSGALDTTYTGFYENENGKWYVANGKVNTSFKGLGKEGNKWLVVLGGKHSSTYTGLIQNGGAFWYVNNGVLDTTFIGITQTGGYSWLVATGKLRNDYSGTYTDGTGTYTIANGKVIE